MNTVTAAGWHMLEEALAVSLQLYRDKEMLILERRGGGRYLQAYAHGNGTFRVEVSANQFLPADEQLDWPELKALLELGWKPPKAGGPPNHYQDVSAGTAAVDLAKLLTSTLERALGVSGPKALQYRAFDSEGHQITLPLLAQAGVTKVEEAALAAQRCPKCKGKDLDLVSMTSILARRSLSEAPVAIAPPRACRGPHCGALFFPDGRYLVPRGSRSTDVPGWTHILAIEARDLEQAELGPDGVLCLAYLSGDTERYLSVPALAVPKMASLLRSHLPDHREPGQAHCDEGVGEVLDLVRRAFAERIVTGRSDFGALLDTAGIGWESYSWP